MNQVFFFSPICTVSHSEMCSFIHSEGFFFFFSFCENHADEYASVISTFAVSWQDVLLSLYFIQCSSWS